MLFDGGVFVAVSNSPFMFPFFECLGGTLAPPHQTNPASFSPAACRHIVLPLSLLVAWKSKTEIAFLLFAFLMS